jgi:hypothetical protein
MWMVTKMLVLVTLTAGIFITESGNALRKLADFNRPSGEVNYMEPQQRKPLPEGTWGGTGIRMTVNADSASVQLDCADGETTERILADRNGNFSAAGKFRRQRPGPVRPNEPPPADVRFIGKVSGNKMSLRIILDSDGSVYGEYNLEKGRNGRIVRCL